MTRGGGPVGTIIGLICFCCIIAIVCAVICKGSGGRNDDDYGQVHEETITEVVVHHDPGTGLPPIHILETPNMSFRQSADYID